MFYVLIFSLAAVVLIVGGVASMRRRQRRGFEADANKANPWHCQSPSQHKGKNGLSRNTLVESATNSTNAGATADMCEALSVARATTCDGDARDLRPDVMSYVATYMG